MKSKLTFFAQTAAIALMAAGPALIAGEAWAQSTTQPGSTEVEEVVVTGFRASLADALVNKRESDLIIESVTAEDIGKFPDQNVAEALQRLPGVQIERENGQGTRVLIRGLSQNVTLLNQDVFLTGLEVFQIGEGNVRNIDSLEGIPSELLGGVDVIKSPDATWIEGGMGGIINLRTRRPFDFTTTTIAGNLRAGEGSHSDNGWEPLGAILLAHQFGDKLAVVATVSYDKSSAHTDVLGGQNRGNWTFSDRVDRPLVAQDYFAPEYRYTTDRNEERERLGASVSVAWRPTDGLELQADWFHSQLEVTTQEASLKYPFVRESPGLDTTQPYEIDENGVLISGTFIANSAEAISFVRNAEISSDNFQFAAKWNDGGPIRANFAAAYSMADMESTSANADVRYTRYSVPTADAGSPTGYSHQPANPAAPANYRFAYDNNDGTLPSFDITSIDDLFTNPNHGYFKSHWVFGDQSDLTNWAVGGDVQWDPQFIAAGNVTITGGARMASREVDYSFGRYLADYHGKGELDGIDFGQNWTAFGYFQDGAIGFKSCELPAGTPGRGPGTPANGCDNRFGNSPPLITPFQTFGSAPGRVETISNFWRSGNAGSSTILVQDRARMKDGVAWIQALYPDTPFTFFESPLDSFKVEEKTTSGYLMADVGERGDRYHINAGLRLVHTELTINQNAALPNPTYWGTDSWNGVLRDFETVTFERDYTDILPSLNVVLDVTDQHKVRFSAARVVARQNLFDLGRGFQTDFTRDPVTNLFTFTSGNRGNPELDPFRANQLDLSWEYYFGAQGLISAAAFWKEVDSFIVTDTISLFVMDQAGGREGPVTLPINGQGGSIKGFELAAQYAWENGFGFTANYTFSDSESPFFNDVDSGLPIPGVARNAFNVQAYYENHGFEARLSYAWRDKSYFGNFAFADRDFSGPTPVGITRTYGIWNRAYGQLDAHLAYQVTKNFGVTLEAINLTEEDQGQYLQYKNLPFTFQSGGRRILFGGRFVFGGA